MKYPRSPVPHSLGTPNGYMTRTEKAKGMNHLLTSIKDAPVPSDAKTLLILDGNATFRIMTDIPSKFQLISYQIFENKHVNFLFSTDRYHDGSIKHIGREQLLNMVPVRHLIITCWPAEHKASRLERLPHDQ